MHPSSVQLSVDFDRSLVSDQGQSVRYLCLSLTASPPSPERRDRDPLDLALVIDASGSMNGPKLAAVKQAGLGLVERLSPRDLLSVVSFASEVITHVEPIPLTPENKHVARRAIESLQARDSTNLSGGWLRGAELVGASARSLPRSVNRVLLLTDGQANDGILEPLELARESEKLCGRGITSSAVGIGEGYSTAQIEPIAVYGGGQVHHANTSEDILDVVAGELSDLAGTAAENVLVEVGPVPGVEIEPLGDFPTTREGHLVRCVLGSLITGRTRLAIFAVKAPLGPAGESIPFYVRVRWSAPGSAETQTAEAAPAYLRFVAGHENESQRRKVALSVEVAKVWQGMLLRQTVEHNRAGRYQEARSLLETELVRLESYCVGLPDTQALLAELRGLSERAGRAMDERTRKDFQNIGHKRYRQEVDHRKQ